MAVKWGKPKDSPFKRINLFKENNGRMRILSPEEEALLLGATRTSFMGKHLEAIVTTALIPV